MMPELVPKSQAVCQLKFWPFGKQAQLYEDRLTYVKLKIDVQAKQK